MFVSMFLTFMKKSIVRRFLRTKLVTMNSRRHKQFLRPPCVRVIIEGKHSLTWAFYDSTCVRAGAGLKRTLGLMDQADSSKVSPGMKFIILLAAVAVRNSNLDFLAQ